MVASGQQCRRVSALPQLTVSTVHLQLPRPAFLVSMHIHHLCAEFIVPRLCLLILSWSIVVLPRTASNLCNLQSAPWVL